MADMKRSEWCNRRWRENKRFEVKSVTSKHEANNSTNERQGSDERDEKETDGD